MNLRRFVERLMPKRGLLDQLLGTRSAEAQGIKTIVSVVFTTAPKTFDGPAIYVTAGSPQMTSRASSVAPVVTTSEMPDDTDTSTFAAASSSFPTSTDNPSSAFPTSSASATSVSHVTSSATLPSSVSTQPSLATAGAQASITSAAASATTTAAASKSGMSGGAKAGLAFGIILALAFVGAGVFFLYRRQKQKNAGRERLDDEKAMMPRPDTLPMHPEPQPTLPSQRNADPVPRLSLRPVTEFQPNLGGDRKSTAANAVPPMSLNREVMPAAATATVAAAATVHKNANGITSIAAPTSKSAWERPGANNAAHDLANPFSDDAANLSSSPPNDLPIAEAANIPLPATPTLPHPASSVQGPPATLAPGPINRDVEPADFPLPVSGPPSPKPPSMNSETAAQPAQAQAPTTSEPSSVPASLMAGGAASAAGAAAVVAASKESPPQSPAKQMAPTSPAANNVHRVQMDFAPSMEDELPIHTGQLVRIQHEYDDGWALVQYMDGKRSGVVPRTCLSKHPLKPRPQNGPPQGRPQMRGPPIAPGMQPPRPLSPASGRSSPAPYAQAPRPLTPTGRNSPAPYAQPPRPSSPYGQGRPASPMTRPRANSNATPYVAYQPNGRSMSPGPYGAGQLKPTPRPEAARRRSNSMGQVSPRVNSPPIGSSPLAPLNQMPARKPVSGAGAASPPPS